MNELNSQPTGPDAHSSQSPSSDEMAEQTYRPSGGWYALTSGLLLGALSISAFLLWVSLTNPSSVPGCGANTTLDCQSVLASRWSKWIGLPVSLFAVGIYGLAIVGLVNTAQISKPTQQRVGWMLLVTTAVTVIGSAGWFVSLQIVQLEAICVWCMSAHTCGVLSSVFILARAPWSAQCKELALGIKQFMPMFVIALLAITILIGGQVLFAPPEQQVTSVAGQGDIDTGPGVDRKITFLNGQFGLQPHAFPILGSADADYIVAYLFDYTCPHCRSLHHTLDLMLQRYGDQIGIVTLPMPLDSNCNTLVIETDPRHESACELAKTAMAVWKHDAEKFPAMHKWMMHSSETPTVDQAKAHAIELLGETEFKDALLNPWIDQQIGRNIGLYERLGQGSIPKLFVRNIFISGRAGSPEQMYKIFEDELGIKPLNGSGLVAPIKGEEHQAEPEETHAGSIVE